MRSCSMTVSLTGNPTRGAEAISIPPWKDENSWHQITLFFQYSCKGNDIRPVWSHAALLAKKIKLVDGLFTELCNQTCRACSEPCCLRATIWYDFSDLLFLYLYQKTLPPRQILKRRGEPCPFLTPLGCALPRLQRPFICTWYVCTVQRQEIDSIKDSSMHRLQDLLREIQLTRKKLESVFVQVVAPETGI